MPYASQRLGTLYSALSPMRVCWPTFPLASALGSTGSEADRPAAFAGFTATLASPDFPCPCIIGYGSSPSRCGPPPDQGDGQTRDLPGSGVLPSSVMGSSTTAERQRLAWRRCSCCLRHVSTTSASARSNFRGSIAHPARSLCTLRRGRRQPRRNTRYRAGATPYPDRTSTGWITPAFPGALTLYPQPVHSQVGGVEYLPAPGQRERGQSAYNLW